VASDPPAGLQESGAAEHRKPVAAKVEQEEEPPMPAGPEAPGALGKGGCWVGHQDIATA